VSESETQNEQGKTRYKEKRNTVADK